MAEMTPTHGSMEGNEFANQQVRILTNRALENAVEQLTLLTHMRLPNIISLIGELSHSHIQNSQSNRKQHSEFTNQICTLTLSDLT